MLAIGALLPVVPAMAEAPDAGPSEPVASEAPVPAKLVLRPLCTSDDGLRRFLVEHVAGPGTRFRVSVAGVQDDRRLRVDVGGARRFWVTAALDDQVEITWADGNATATPTEDPCVPGILYGDPDPAPEPSTAPVPDATDDRAPRPRRPPAARERAVARGDTSPSGRDARSRPRPDEQESRSDAPAIAPRAAEPEDAPAAPRPRRSGDAVVCPNGWVPVDRDRDGRVETSDRCEVVIETSSGAPPESANITMAALLVTIALLVTSVGFGAVSRRRT